MKAHPMLISPLPLSHLLHLSFCCIYFLPPPYYNLAAHVSFVGQVLLRWRRAIDEQVGKKRGGGGLGGGQGEQRGAGDENEIHLYE